MIVLSKPVSLNENGDFRRIYARGKSYPDKGLVTYVMRNRFGYNRIGITAGKKTGNSVQRNRSRRVIRAAYYGIEDKLCSGYDIIFVARGKTKYLKSTSVQRVMYEQLRQAGVIKE